MRKYIGLHWASDMIYHNSRSVMCQEWSNSWISLCDVDKSGLKLFQKCGALRFAVLFSCSTYPFELRQGHSDKSLTVQAAHPDIWPSRQSDPLNTSAPLHILTCDDFHLEKRLTSFLKRWYRRGTPWLPTELAGKLANSWRTWAWTAQGLSDVLSLNCDCAGIATGGKNKIKIILWHRSEEQYFCKTIHNPGVESKPQTSRNSLKVSSQVLITKKKKKMQH